MLMSRSATDTVTGTERDRIRRRTSDLVNGWVAPGSGRGARRNGSVPVLENSACEAFNVIDEGLMFFSRFRYSRKRRPQPPREKDIDEQARRA